MFLSTHGSVSGAGLRALRGELAGDARVVDSVGLERGSDEFALRGRHDELRDGFGLPGTMRPLSRGSGENLAGDGTL